MSSVSLFLSLHLEKVVGDFHLLFYALKRFNLQNGFCSIIHTNENCIKSLENVLHFNRFYLLFYSGSQHNLHVESHNGHGYAKKVHNSSPTTQKKNMVRGERTFFSTGNIVSLGRMIYSLWRLYFVCYYVLYSREEFLAHFNFHYVCIKSNSVRKAQISNVIVMLFHL